MARVALEEFNDQEVARIYFAAKLYEAEEKGVVADLRGLGLDAATGAGARSAQAARLANRR